MNRRLVLLASLTCVALVLAVPAARAQDDFEADLKAVRDGWAIANYKTPQAGREAAFEKLVTQAGAFSAKYPQRPEALIWDGIVLSTYAGVKGGLGALGPAKESKAKFEAALAMDEKALDGSAHTSLGTLYHKVPGFPIAFGSDKKARMHLEKALAISPGAIDPNYFYGEFLYDEGEYAKALQHLETALKAPPRPGREIADEGRRQEILALIAKTKKEL
jgi:tetratricopeptide (TPR) repeat protein